MKKACVLFFLIPFFILACSTMSNEYSKINDDPEEKLYQRKDKNSGAVFIYHEHYLNNLLDPFNIHIQMSNGTILLIADFYNSDEEWIYFDTARFVNSDDNHFDMPIQKQNRKVINGYATEDGHVILKSQDIDSLENLLKSNSVKLKLAGKFSKEYDISQERIESLREIIAYYKNGLHASR